MSFHGIPCWFELSVADPDRAEAFYTALFGWEIADAGMPGFDYRLARAGADMVAGVMPLSALPEGALANWMLYIAVDDCDATAAQAVALGGKLWKEPADIPGTGRYAVLADPQGAVFGILQPLPMDPPPEGGAWNQKAAGHGTWLELMSTDPQAALGFYGALFGWQADEVMDTGEMGPYHLFRHQGAQLGGMMGLGPSPYPNWLCYFGVDDLAAAMAQVNAMGGTVPMGPVEVPGPALIAVVQDNQGAWFAMVGPKP